MPLHFFPKSQQAAGNFNNGAILENKPIGFPGEGGRLRPYSNLFYWAHAWTPEGESTIGLHPHQGFEIMSFVLKGEIEHYDTKLQQWRKLKKGDMQIIRSGNGISHSEKILAESAIFQIWTDPNLRTTMHKPASYDDFPSAEFPVKEVDGMTVKTYKGEGSPLEMDTPGLEILEIKVPAGKRILPFDKAKIFSAYLMDGQLKVGQDLLEKDGFILGSELDEIRFEAVVDSTLFVIQSLNDVGYPTYASIRR